MKPIRIMFACNDPDNGYFTGNVEAVHVVDGMLELESWGRPRRLVELDGAIRFAGKTWPIMSSQEWFGNWCWNAYSMKPEAAIGFLCWLRRRKLFDCTAWWDRLYDLWNGNEPVYAYEIEALLKEAA